MNSRKIIFSVILISVMVLVSGCGIKKKVNTSISNNSKEIENTYLDLYREYLYDDLFDSKEIASIDTFNGIIIDVDEFKEPIMIANYHDSINGNFIKAYYIKDGVVNETKTHKANQVKYLYNIKDDKLELFIYEDDSYKSYSALIDILTKNETDVRGVSENEIGEEYVLTSDNIKYGVVDKNDYDNTFNKLDELYKNRDTSTLDNELKAIKEELVVLKDDEITYKDYHISYGKYNYDDLYITLNKDKTYRFDYDINGDYMHIDDTCKYGYKYIYCVKGSQRFRLEVVGDNKVKYIDKTKKYNNGIFSYGG